MSSDKTSKQENETDNKKSDKSKNTQLKIVLIDITYRHN